MDFVPLTVAGQRRTLTGFLYWQSFTNSLSLANFVGGACPAYAGSSAFSPPRYPYDRVRNQRARNKN